MRNADGATILADPGRGRATQREGDLMIDSVSIENFRCFKEARAEDLGLINVVVGDNASGKTTFLEALYFTATNSPQAHLKFFAWRHNTGGQVGFSSGTLESGEYWGDLFHWYGQGNPISISLKGSPSKELIIERFEDVDTVSSTGAEMVAPLRFGWSYDGGEFEFSIPTFSEENIKLPRAGRAINGAMITAAVSPSELAKRWSDLDREGRTDEVLSIVSAEFPEIVGLSSQPDASVGNMVYAELRGQAKKIPLAYVSGGINRLVYILYNIAAYPGGCVYVDEFDVGIYHAHLGGVWSAILRLAKDQETQVFLSTHSGEALTALAPIIAEDEADFRLIKTSRDWKKGCSSVKVFGGRNLSAAVKAHVEVR